jgi:predicted transcriptional regulator of viral defense system
MYLGRTEDAVHGLAKRAVASGKIIRIRRGLYTIANKRDRVPDGRVLCQSLYGPSYISLEYALSYHNLIPEAVYTITSVSLGKSKNFSTPLGEFSFQRVPQNILYTQVERLTGAAGLSFFMATPLKALCDTLYCGGKKWAGLAVALDELRIDFEDLPEIEAIHIDELLENYRNNRVRTFLKGIRKELA